jgi:acetoacetyl-CoA synthetase
MNRNPETAGTDSPLPQPRIVHFALWLSRTRDLSFDPRTPAGFEALRKWSIADLRGFWEAVWDYFDLCSHAPVETVLTSDQMPGARWFVGAQVNYAQQVFRHAETAHDAGHPALVWADEAALARGVANEVAWPELRRRVASLAAALARMGVQPGDRVCAVLPNAPEAVVAFLAAASVGAIWSVCSPDMGPLAILDRFRQIEPKVLIACDAYTHGGVRHDRRGLLADVVAGLPSLSDWVLWHRPEQTRNGVADDAADDAVFAVGGVGPRRHDWAVLIADEVAFAPVWLPFEHPLWIVYSSGTTGLPKPIVHGHGGVMVEALKGSVLQNNVGASAVTGDRICWNSSTTWIVWNGHVSALLAGTTLCLFEGNAAGAIGTDAQGRRLAPDWGTLWRFAALTGTTWLGVGAAFITACLKAGVEPQQVADLSRLRALGVTGSPLSEAGYQWAWDHLPRSGGQPIWLAVISGGTDIAGAFVGGVCTLPTQAGVMQARCLGAAVEAWSEPDAQGRGRPLIDEVGELVCVKPMPSMPLFFWGDTSGQRYRDSYFDTYPATATHPAVWRHGDWIRITPGGGAIIYGRSDATINRHGIRMGTAELYRAVEALPEVVDSLVIDLEYLGRDSWMPLFVVLRDGLSLDAALVQQLRQVIREALSARHVPDEIFQVTAVPRTLSGKKMELPVKKLMLGAAADSVMKPDAMANADCVPWFAELARRRAG